MTGTLHSRIVERLKEVGISAARASRDAGMSQDFIRDLKRKPDVRPGAESLQRLASILGTTAEYLLYGQEHPSSLPVQGLPIVGVVEAGQFRDISLSNQDEEYQTVNVVRDGRFPRSQQYALLVSGDSMDKHFADGSYVICASFPETGLEPKNGMFLHIERRIGGTQLVETTLKQVEYRDGRCFLMPRSSNAKHKEIEIREDDDFTETVIRGLVIGTYSPVAF